MKLRKAELKDYEEVVDMYYELTKTIYSDINIGEKVFFYEAVINWFSKKKDIILATTDDGEIAGFSLAYITNVHIVEPYYYGDIAFVKKRYRKSKAAYMLYNNVINYAQKIGLQVRAKAFVGAGNKDQVDKIQSKFGEAEFIEFRTKGKE